MPHIDELLGIATVASAGLFASIALQPQESATARSAGARVHAPVATSAAMPAVAPFGCLPLVARVTPRSVLYAERSHGGKGARECATKDQAQPDA